MLLVVDVGNTHTVLGLYDEERLIHDFRIETAKGRTSDEHHVLLLNLLSLAGVQRSDVRASILASVVPTFNDTVIEAVDRAFDHEIMVVGPGIKTGMPVLYENPREVGADRIVNAVAAYERVKGAAIVVDFGTATTFDCISANGSYLGGVIAPGIGSSSEALFQRTARLPRVELRLPEHAIGRTTSESMRSGILWGAAGQVDALVRRIALEMRGTPHVIATGGYAALIAPACETINLVDEALTLKGMRLIWEGRKR